MCSTLCRSMLLRRWREPGGSSWIDCVNGGLPALSSCNDVLVRVSRQRNPQINWRGALSLAGFGFCGQRDAGFPGAGQGLAFFDLAWGHFFGDYFPAFAAIFNASGGAEVIQHIVQYHVLWDSLLLQHEPVLMQELESAGVTGSVAGQRDMLNTDYTFSTFVVGRNNEFAHAASHSIAENPGKESYNPLFICGPTGMGKTHLLNAVGNHIRVNFPHLRILYISAERFLNECISSIRRHEMDKFRLRYREKCDVLLMDDIQVLGRGEAVQEEFFHTLNDFFEKDQQVIVASDRMPKDIKGLEDRIRTRLEWGLIADIQMPDIETRVAILKYKSERKNMMLPNEVVSYVARISKRSIRELEGNLNKVKMFSELQGLPIGLDLAKRVLTTHDDIATLAVDDVVKHVSEHYEVRMPDMKSKTRTKTIVIAREGDMELIKKDRDRSLVDI